MEDKVKQQGEIPKTLEDLDATISRLQSKVSELTETIGTVLVVSPPKEDKVSTSSYGCHLAQTINDFNNRISSLNDLLDDLITNCQL